MQHAGPHHIPTVAVVALLVGGAVLVSGAWAAAKRGDRPRIIATTDGEIDDRCSMVRFLLYANEWDIEGIIYSSSKFHWDGHKWAGTKWIEGQIDQYAKAGCTIHVILEVTDDGTPPLTRYRRIIVTVAG